MTEQKSFIITTDKNFYQLGPSQIVNGIKKRSFISHSLDSMEDNTVWHRCKIDCQIPPDANVYIAYYASNQNKIMYQDEEQELDEILRSPHIAAKEKDALLAAFWQEVVINGNDFPLHKAKGRYLWLKIEFATYGQEETDIKDIKIDFPLRPLTYHLPEIYQQDEQSFNLLNRFLGIFQSLMDDLDYQIKDVSSYLDVDLVNSDFLQWLSKWLDINDYYVWKEDKLRIFIKNAYKLYQIKGTKTSIEKIVEIYTGEKPIIVENHEIEDFLKEADLFRLYTKLYGDNNYTFTVLVKEQFVPTTQQYLELKQIIENFKPAYTVLNLIVLRPYMFLDSYSYLGVNTVLSGSASLVLDGKATIPFDTTIEEWRIVE